MVTILEMAVDSRGVKVGLAEANRALDETAKKADKAEKEVTQLGDKSKTAGRNMSAAFAATGGGLAVTHGLAGMSDGFRRGSASMTAFAASQALLDMGRMAEDMKGVTSATGGTMSVFSKLGMVMKAHPIMTIATVLAGAASVMQIFGGETEEAATEMDRLATAMEKVRVGREAAQLLGISQLGPAQQTRQNVISAAEMYQAGGGTMTYADMARSLGIPMGRLMGIQQAAGAGMPQVLSRATNVAPLSGYGAGYQSTLSQMEPFPIAEQAVPRQAAQAILRRIYGSIQSEIKQLQPGAASGARAGVTGAGVGGDASYGTGALLMRRAGDPGTPLTPEELRSGFWGSEHVTAKAEQNMDQLIRQGEQFGQTIGDAFMRIAQGTTTARQAMAQLISQFAQAAASGIFRQIGGAVAGGFAPTQTQTTANVDPAPIPDNS